MRNKLPILLALVLMAVAATPWLRSLESQRWNTLVGPTTVPPPVANVSGAGAPAQRVGVPTENGTRSVPDTLSQPSQPVHPKPQTLMEYAVLSVENQPSISAQIAEEGELIGHPMAGAGRYLEVRHGPIPMIRLDLTVRVDATITSLVQVCNGTTFWSYRKLPNGEKLTKLDAVQAITALEKAASRMPRDAIMAAPGLGGLGRLMRGLNAEFDFTAGVPDNLEGTPVWKLSGAWKPDVLARLLPNQKDAAKSRSFDTAKLPVRLPDSVTIYLRQSDYFPLRIDYCRNNLSKSAPRCLMSLKFGEINFNAPIDSSQFLFTPGSLEYNDRTDEFMRALGVER